MLANGVCHSWWFGLENHWFVNHPGGFCAQNARFSAQMGPQTQTTGLANLEKNHTPNWPKTTIYRHVLVRTAQRLAELAEISILNQIQFYFHLTHSGAHLELDSFQSTRSSLHLNFTINFTYYIGQSENLLPTVSFTFSIFSTASHISKILGYA